MNILICFLICFLFNPFIFIVVYGGVMIVFEKRFVEYKKKQKITPFCWTNCSSVCCASRRLFQTSCVHVGAAVTQTCKYDAQKHHRVPASGRLEHKVCSPFQVMRMLTKGWSRQDSRSFKGPVCHIQSLKRWAQNSKENAFSLPQSHNW